MSALLTPDEVAQHLRIKVDRLHRLRRQGRIAAVNVGTPRRPEWRYKPSAVAAFERANETRVA